MNDSIWKKKCAQSRFSALVKKIHSAAFWKLAEKCSTLHACGYRKIIFISFIWYSFFWNCAMDEATMTSWKSGLILSSFKILISVLSNKAVLGSLKPVYYMHIVTAVAQHKRIGQSEIVHCAKMDDDKPSSFEFIDCYQTHRLIKKSSRGKKGISFYLLCVAPIRYGPLLLFFAKPNSNQGV